MESLPSVLPVFRVRSTILMPNAQLPVVMSENDYMGIAPEIVENNIIGVIQPKPISITGTRNKDFANSFRMGCAGKITDVNFVDGEITVNIFGICRFEAVGEFSVDSSGIEKVAVSYERFLVDMDSTTKEFEFDKNRLLNALDVYFKTLDISPNWQEIERTPVDVLVSALAMACPFHPSEKQSLLETVDIRERSGMITKFIEMNSFDRYNTANTIN